MNNGESLRGDNKTYNEDELLVALRRKYEKKATLFTPSNKTTELMLDWRNITAARKGKTIYTKNFVSSVKDQTSKGLCAASYAFATMALLEFDFVINNQNKT